MWIYKKQLQFPVNIRECNPRLAKVIISQFGGADGELAASMRYLAQRYHMPHPEAKAMLTDIGTEELSHLEIVGSVVRQLTCRLSAGEMKAAGLDDYFVDHTTGVYLQSAAGHPFTSAYLQVKGDPITDLHENLAADAAFMQEQQDPKTGLKNGRNTNVGTSFLTHCSQMKEPSSAQAVRRHFCVSRVKTVKAGRLAHKGLKQRV